MAGVPCPRCSSPLVLRRLGGLAFDGCTTCNGVLIEQRTLGKLLGRVAAGLDLDAAPARVPDMGGGLSCPLCTSEMDNYGFQAATLVMIDRCSWCNLVFVDGAELTPLAHQWARSHARSGDARDHTLSELRRTNWSWGVTGN